MSLKSDAIASSAAFDLIAEGLKSEALRKDAIKQAKAIFAFTITNDKGETESWYLDLKKDGVVGKGAAPPGGKADVTLSVSDKDFGALVAGTANAQRLFMGGKLKVKGNVMKATKIEPILKKARTDAKL
ncbi:hypothetical protein KEM56_000893 [Ascosphaera pollenicola]|nr:hypothetical protein KEM56_000893 [Ascosphaera pollenicola]